MSRLSTLWGTVRRLPPRSYQTVADQAVSSVGNFLFVAVVARTATVAEFGAFSLAYALYAIALGAGRAVGGEILLLRGVQRPEDARAESERLMFLVVAIGALAGLFLVGLGVVLDDPLGEILSALGICLPVLLLQDAIRYCFFARGEPTRAVLNDSVWTVAQVAFFAAILSLSPDAGAAALVLGWTGGAAVAVILGLSQTRLVPRPSLHLARGHGDRSRARSFLADFGLSALALNAGLYVIAGVAGLAAAGAVRGAMLLFAPRPRWYRACASSCCQPWHGRPLTAFGRCERGRRSWVLPTPSSRCCTAQWCSSCRMPSGRRSSVTPGRPRSRLSWRSPSCTPRGPPEHPRWRACEPLEEDGSSSRFAQRARPCISDASSWGALCGRLGRRRRHGVRV